MSKKSIIPPKELTAQREREAWRLRCRGWEQWEIAEKLGVTQSAISQMLKRVETREAKRHSDEYDRMKIRVDGKLGHIYREALDAWHKSKEPQRRVRQTTDENGEAVTVNEIVEREGTVAYLDRSMAAIEAQMRLWGLNVNAADQEISSSVAAIAASMAARGVKYEQNQAAAGNPESPPPATDGGTSEVQDRPGPVQ